MINPASPRAIAVSLSLLAAAATGGAVLLASGYDRTHPVGDAVGEAGLAKPTPAECAVASTLIGALHASGEDKTLPPQAGAVLSLDSHAYRSASLPGLTPDQSADLTAKSNGDWRWCSGMGAYVRSLGWAPMTDYPAAPEISLTRPALSKAGDRAALYEIFAPRAGRRGAYSAVGQVTWLVTLRRTAGSDAAWQIVSRREAPDHP